jgi:hypothetical protein
LLHKQEELPLFNEQQKRSVSWDRLQIELKASWIELLEKLDPERADSSKIHAWKPKEISSNPEVKLGKQRDDSKMPAPTSPKRQQIKFDVLADFCL